MTALDKEEELEDDASPPVIEGGEVEDDQLLQKDLKNAERASWPVSGESLREAMFREQRWMSVGQSEGFCTERQLTMSG